MLTSNAISIRLQSSIINQIDTQSQKCKKKSQTQFCQYSTQSQTRSLFTHTLKRPSLRLKARNHN